MKGLKYNLNTDPISEELLKCRETFMYGDFKMQRAGEKIKLQLAEIELMVDKGEWSRAGGECTCTVCGKEYIRHPNVSEKYYWLTILCDGTLVKL